MERAVSGPQFVLMLVAAILVGIAVTAGMAWWILWS